MLRPIQKQALGASKKLAAPDAVEVDDLAALPAGEVPLLARSNADELARANLLKQQLAQLVKAEPASSARAVQAWVRGETT